MVLGCNKMMPANISMFGWAKTGVFPCFSLKHRSLTAGVVKCPILGILDITFKYLLEIISPILGWCSIGTFNDPCTVHRCTSAEKAWLSDAATKLGKAMPAIGEVAAKAPAAPTAATQVEQAQLLFGFKGRTRIYVLYKYNYIYIWH